MCSLPRIKQESAIGQQRVRRATLTGIATLGVRGVAIAASLVSIPLTAKYLGTERFGLWLMLSMLLNWVSLTDLGLSNSLTNLLATAHGQQNEQQAQQAVSSTFWMTIALALLLGVSFSLIYPWVNWERVFNVTSTQAKAEVGLAVVVFFAGFILKLPLGIAGRIYSAYQQGYFYQAWIGVSSVLSIAALLIAIQLQMGLPQLVAVFFGTSLLGDLLATLHVFGRRWRTLSPKLANFDKQQAKWLLQTGLQFWVIQISSIIFFQTDLVIVAQLFGAETVATYGTVLKLFTLLGTIQTAFLFPLWPAYGEAFSRKDIPWIIQTFRRTIVLTLMWSISSGIILSLFANSIINLWLGQTFVIEPLLILAMLVTSVFLALGHCIGTLLNGLGMIKFQVIFGLAAGVANLILSVVLGRWIGVAGVCWATAICLLIFSLGIIGIHTLKILYKMDSNFKLTNNR